MDRFWSKVVKGNECWEWHSSIDRHGYGHIKVGKKSILAHRMAYELTYGVIPPNMLVCHTCDNRKCVNPTHLYLGTHLDNMADMRAKGRQGRVKAQGSAHGSAKLTEQDIIDIRARYATGNHTYEALGREYGVGKSAIYKIVKGLRWKLQSA